MTRPWEKALTRFEQLPMRERRFVISGAIVLAVAVCWWLLIAPALRDYRASGAHHAKLDAQLEQMQLLSLEAKRLQGIPRVSPNQALTWLEGSLPQLGKATLSTQGGNWRIQFTAASPQALAAWLTQARTQAKLLPSQASLKKTAGNWDGVVVFERPL